MQENNDMEYQDLSEEDLDKFLAQLHSARDQMVAKKKSSAATKPKITKTDRVKKRKMQKLARRRSR